MYIILNTQFQQSYFCHQIMKGPSPSYLPCLLLSCLPVCLPAALPVCLSLMSLVCLSVIVSTNLNSLSVFLLVCSLLPSSFYSPSYLSCLLLSCLPVFLPAVLFCLSVMLLFSIHQSANFNIKTELSNLFHNFFFE
jgi:hypothetical protein